MKAIIMAGGLGTRLRPITDNIPKSLIPVGGKPIIHYLMESLSKVSNDFIVTVSYRSEKVIDLLSGNAGRNKNILFSVEKEPLGTAGGLKKVEKFVEDTFIVGNADTIFQQEVRGLVNFHKKNKDILTLGLTRVDDPSEYGVAKVSNGRVVEFQEKPKTNPISNLANSGIYVMEPEVFDYIEKGRPVDVAKELLPALQRDGKRIGGFKMSGVWIDIGRPRDLIRANIFVATSTERKIPGSKLSGKIYLGKNVKIGKDCVLENAAIYGGSVIEDNVHIKNSVIYDNSTIESGSRIEDSILSFGTNLGQGVVITDSVLGGGLLLRKGAKIEGTVVSLGEDKPYNY